MTSLVSKAIFTDFSSVTVLVFASGEVLGGVIAPIIPGFSLLHLNFFFDSTPAPLSVFFLGFNSTPFSSRFHFIEASFMCVAADGGSLVYLIGLPLLLGSFLVARLLLCFLFQLESLPGFLDGLDSFFGHLVGLNSFFGIDFQVNECEDGCVFNLDVKV